MSEQLVSILKQLDATFEIEGIFNIHSNAGAVTTSIFDSCYACDLRTQINLNGVDWDCDRCGRNKTNQTWFAVNQPSTGALLSIRSNKDNQIIGALVITDTEEAQRLVSHEIVVLEEIQKNGRVENLKERELPNLTFLRNYLGAGLNANTLLVTDEKIFVGDKIAHLDSEFAILDMKVPNGNYLGVNFCYDFNDVAINADGEETHSEIRPYVFLLINYDQLESLSSIQMYEDEIVSIFYSYFQAYREAVSWLVMGMHDDYLNKWLVDYLPVPSYVLESVMPYRGYQKPTPFNVFLFPSVDEVLDTHKTYEEFTAQSQALLDWVGKNHDKWHIELSESEGKAVRVFTQNSRNDSWEKLWAGWAPLQENFKLNVSTEAWKEMKQKSS